MASIEQIRQLIVAGKTNLEIEAYLRAEANFEEDLAWTNPRRTFSCLAATMRRAHLNDCGVPAQHVLVELELFRTMWEELAAQGDAPGAEGVVLQLLEKVAPASSVSEAHKILHADLVRLSVPVRETADADRQARASAERRYHRKIGKHTVICLAALAHTIADASVVLFNTFQDRPGFKDLFTEEALRPCTILLLAPYQPWSEMLAEQGSL